VAVRREEVKITADVSNFVTRLAAASAAAGGFAGSLEKADNNMGGLVQTGLALGPALVPIASAAVPVIAGLTTQLGFAVIAAGTTALAFNGVGGALTALNKYKLEPTTANFVALQNAMAELSPAGEDFVRFLHKAGGELQDLQGIAQAGMFPGVEKGITSLLALLPKVEAVVSTVSTTLGNLVAEGGRNLNSPEWVKFFDYLNTTAAPTLTEMGKTFGNVVQGIASMVMAFDPLSRSFSTGLLDMSRSFAHWSANLDQSQGFHDFVTYIQTNGPRALDALGSIVNALAQLVGAAAPIGSVMLPIITRLVDGLAAIADSPAGPALIGLAVAVATLSKAMTLLRMVGPATLTSMSTNAAITGRTFTGLGRAAGALGVLLVAAEGIKAIGKASDQALPGVQTLTGKLLDLGKIPVGFSLMSIGGQFDNLGASIDVLSKKRSLFDNLQRPGFGLIPESWVGELRKARNETDALDGALANIVSSGSAGQARRAFADLALSQNLSATQQKRLLALLPQYREALAGSKNAATLAAGATKELGNSDAAAARAARLHAAATLKLVDAMRTQRSEAIGAGNAEIAYQQAIDDARKSLAANGKTLDITTEKGRANKTTLLNLAGTWNALSTAAKNTVGAHHAAIAAFVATAVAMGDNADHARAYALRLYEIPTRRATVITADTGQARDAIDAIQRQINALYGKTIVVRTQHMDVRLAPIHSATGGYMRGPGTPTSDSIPAWLSDREYVVRAAAVEKYGVHMFDRLNAMTYAGGGLVAQRFAGGGSVAGDGTASAMRDLRHELDRFKAAIADNVTGLHDLRSAARDFRSTVASNFQTDIFGNGLAGADLMLAANRNDARKFNAATKRDKRLGLHGAALKALLASGDLATASEMNTRREVRQFQHLFASRAQATASLGRAAGTEVFGHQLDHQTRELAHLRKTVDRLNERLKHLGADVHDGAKAGVGGRNRVALQRRRAGQ
jgi:hypothetical protein